MMMTGLTRIQNKMHKNHKMTTQMNMTPPTKTKSIPISFQNNIKKEGSRVEASSFRGQRKTRRPARHLSTDFHVNHLKRAQFYHQVWCPLAGELMLFGEPNADFPLSSGE